MWAAVTSELAMALPRAGDRMVPCDDNGPVRPPNQIAESITSQVYATIGHVSDTFITLEQCTVAMACV